MEDINKISFNNLPEFHPHRVEEVQRFMDHRDKPAETGNIKSTGKPAEKASGNKVRAPRKKKEARAEISPLSYLSNHDLKEPLRKIRTFSSRILEKEYQNLSDAGKDYFNRMQNAAQRMQTIIDNLTELSHLSSDEQLEKTDIESMVQDIKTEFSESIAAKNAHITTSGLEKVNVIPAQFRTLLKNLISNSLKFSKPENQLEIRITGQLKKGAELRNELQPKKKYFHIRVADNGIGFEPEFSEKIFEVFQRLNSRDEYEGSGIGLAICKKIVENHQGVIKAEGEPDKGACFDLFIPVVQN